MREQIACSPLLSSVMTAEMPAIPEANALAATPPSMAARFFSRALRVGLMVRA